jgi:hypothetical protein
MLTVVVWQLGLPVEVSGQSEEDPTEEPPPETTTTIYESTTTAAPTNLETLDYRHAIKFSFITYFVFRFVT